MLIIICENNKKRITKYSQIRTDNSQMINNKKIAIANQGQKISMKASGKKYRNLTNGLIYS